MRRLKKKGIKGVREEDETLPPDCNRSHSLSCRYMLTLVILKDLTFPVCRTCGPLQRSISGPHRYTVVVGVSTFSLSMRTLKSLYWKYAEKSRTNRNNTLFQWFLPYPKKSKQSNSNMQKLYVTVNASTPNKIKNLKHNAGSISFASDTMLILHKTHARTSLW
jgi:hypothetical protein